MRRALLVLAAIAMFAGTGYAADATFHGNIMDSACAKSGQHKMGNAKACTEGCVKGGSAYVLYDPLTKMTYQLDDQKKPADFAGEAVTVTGMYDRATKTIHVSDMKHAS